MRDFNKMAVIVAMSPLVLFVCVSMLDILRTRKVNIVVTVMFTAYIVAFLFMYIWFLLKQLGFV